MNDFLHFRRIGFFTPLIQGMLIVLLYVLTTLIAYAQYRNTGTMFGYPLAISILFVPIYEELLFRGLIFGWLSKNASTKVAFGVTSLLFGLWHLKNIFWLGPERVAMQMLYTGLLFSPIACWITVKTRSVWPMVILHYFHNLLAI